MNVTLVWHLLVSACLVPLLLRSRRGSPSTPCTCIIPGFAYSAPFEDLKLKP
jgi:hypothetical protein